MIPNSTYYRISNKSFWNKAKKLIFSSGFSWLQISDVSCTTDTHTMLLGIIFKKIWEGITGF